jgi:thioredoxin-like negative regulator of GroEL
MRSVNGVESLFASGNTRAAYRKLGETLIRPDSPWRRYAAQEAAYVLIRLNRLDEATAILAKIPADERNVNVELLDHLAAAYSGKIAGLKKNYPAFLEKLPPMENLRVIDLFWNASQVALREKDFAFADQLLNDVKLFTKDKKLQQSLAHQQIEIQLQYDPAKTVKTVLDYVKRFPDDPQRYKLLYNTAGKLYAAGYGNRAVEVLEFLIGKDAPFIGTPIKDLKLKDNLLVTDITRGGVSFIPGGNDTIEAGDSILVVTTRTGLYRIRDIFE